MTATAKKAKLTVTNELGTFTRTTARTYTHVLVAVDKKGAAGTLGWAGRADLAEKLFNDWAKSFPNFADWATIALCSLDGAIVRRADH